MQKPLDNPFIITGKYLSEDYFCDRETETTELVKYHLNSSSSVQGALKPLLENETIVRNGESYHIDNHFFSIWLSRR